MKRVLLILLTLFSFTYIEANTDLFISEVYYNPPQENTGIPGACNGDQCEYIEITNCTNVAIPIGGYYLMDGTGNNKDFIFPLIDPLSPPNALVIGPMETIIITRSASSFASTFPGSLARVFEGAPNLNNSLGETLRLFSNADLLCSQVTYTPATGDGDGCSVHFDKTGMLIPTGGIGQDPCEPSPGLSTPLPVELLFFKAEVNEGQVAISWATASEINNDYFTVETSTNGKLFHEITRIAGAGNSVDEINYNFIHESPVEGLNYYRLKQTDFDGTFAYSDVVVVSYGKSAGVSLQPNIAKEEINIVLQKGYERDVEIQIFNVHGAKVYEGILPADALNRTIRISDLNTGHYFLRINKLNDPKVMRFTKL